MPYKSERILKSGRRRKERKKNENKLKNINTKGKGSKFREEK